MDTDELHRNAFLIILISSAYLQEAMCVDPKDGKQPFGAKNADSAVADHSIFAAKISGLIERFAELQTQIDGTSSKDLNKKAALLKEKTEVLKGIISEAILDLEKKDYKATVDWHLAQIQAAVDEYGRLDNGQAKRGLKVIKSVTEEFEHLARVGLKLGTIFEHKVDPMNLDEYLAGLSKSKGPSWFMPKSPIENLKVVVEIGETRRKLEHHLMDKIQADQKMDKIQTDQKMDKIQADHQMDKIQADQIVVKNRPKPIAKMKEYLRRLSKSKALIESAVKKSVKIIKNVENHLGDFMKFDKAMADEIQSGVNEYEDEFRRIGKVMNLYKCISLEAKDMDLGKIKGHTENIENVRKEVDGLKLQGLTSGLSSLTYRLRRKVALYEYKVATSLNIVEEIKERKLHKPAHTHEIIMNIVDETKVQLPALKSMNNFFARLLGELRAHEHKKWTDSELEKRELHVGIACDTAKDIHEKAEENFNKPGSEHYFSKDLFMLNAPFEYMCTSFENILLAIGEEQRLMKR